MNKKNLKFRSPTTERMDLAGPKTEWEDGMGEFRGWMPFPKARYARKPHQAKA
jgi:hypothetical protein